MDDLPAMSSLSEGELGLSPRQAFALSTERAHADRFVYDEELEEKSFCRSLLTAKDLQDVKSDIKENGFFTIQTVRHYVSRGFIKHSYATRNENLAIDAETIILLDSRTNYQIFIAGDSVYTREELYATFPFVDLMTSPEDVFVCQEVGIFDAKPSFDGAAFEYVARDLGDSSVPFVMIEDLVRAHTHKGHVPSRPLLKSVKSKVFLGKQKWDDFLHTAKVVRCMKAAAVSGPSLALARLAPGERPVLQLQAGAAEEAARLARREAELAEREARLQETERRVNLDLARIERALLNIQLGSPGGAAGGATGGADSVEI